MSGSLYAQPAVGQPQFNLASNYGSAAIGQPAFQFIPPQAQFAIYNIPPAFAPSSAGGSPFDAVSLLGPSIFAGSALMAFTGSPAIFPIAAMGLYANSIYSGALNGPFPAGESMGVPGLGIPGVDPSAGSGAQ